MMMIKTVAELSSQEDYFKYLKLQAKLAKGEGVFYVSKKKMEVGGIEGRAVLLGPKAVESMRHLKKEGILFREGTCVLEGDTLKVAGLDAVVLKEAVKTLKKLHVKLKLEPADGPPLGDEGDAANDQDEAGDDGGDDSLQKEWAEVSKSMAADIKRAVEAGFEKQRITTLVKQAGDAAKAGEHAQAIETFDTLRELLDSRQDDADADSDAKSGADGNMAKQAETIAKAVNIWNKTEQAAQKELRKLQKALLGLDDPRTKPVIQGLESIMQRMDRVDDEAKAVESAARSGDASAFGQARDGFVQKMHGILRYVEQDELIRQADANPVTEIRIRETVTKSLNQLLKAI